MMLVPPRPPFPVPSFLIPPSPLEFPPLKAAQGQFLNTVTPSLSPEEEVYVRSLFDLGATLAGIDPKAAQSFNPDDLLKLALGQGSRDEESLSELLDIVSRLGSNSEQGEQLRTMASQVIEKVFATYRNRLSTYAGSLGSLGLQA